MKRWVSQKIPNDKKVSPSENLHDILGCKSSFTQCWGSVTLWVLSLTIDLRLGLYYLPLVRGAFSFVPLFISLISCPSIDVFPLRNSLKG